MVEWFLSLGWLSCYALAAAAAIVPAAISAALCGTFGAGSSERCRVPFVRDYTFIFLWCLPIPISLTMLPWCNGQLLAGLARLSTEGILCDGALAGFRRFAASGWPWLIGVGIAVPGQCMVYFRNLISIRQSPGKVWSWWQPGGRFALSTAVFLLICSAAGAVFIGFASRYVCAVAMVRQGVAAAASVPASLGGPASPVWSMFRAFALTFLPLACVPTCIWAARTFRGRISPTDPISILNIVSVPAAVLLLLVLPIALTGVPARLGAQRDRVMHQLVERRFLLIDALAGAPADPANGQRFAELVRLAETEEELKAAVPVWPLPSHALRKFLLALIPGLVAVAANISQIAGVLMSRSARGG